MKYLFASVGPLLRPLVVDLLEGSISVPVDNIYFGFTIPWSELEQFVRYHWHIWMSILQVVLYVRFQCVLIVDCKKLCVLVNSSHMLFWFYLFLVLSPNLETVFSLLSFFWQFVQTIMEHGPFSADQSLCTTGCIQSFCEFQLQAYNLPVYAHASWRLHCMSIHRKQVLYSLVAIFSFKMSSASLNFHPSIHFWRYCNSM